MRVRLLRLIGLVFLVSANLHAQGGLPPGFVDELVVRRLNAAATMTMAPDGRIFIAERVSGRIRVVSEGELEKTPYYHFTDVVGELRVSHFHGGLLGMAFDPDFMTTPHLYVFYTKGDGVRQFNRLVRLTGVDSGGSLTVLIDNIRRGTVHQSGRLEFGADGKLFMVIGDLQIPEEAQDPGALAGKILRLNTDASAPPDNPFFGLDGHDPRVFAMGIRNAFGLAVDPTNGVLYESENGEGGPFDELNFVPPGANLGYPECLGPCGREFTDPIYTWKREIAPAGLAYYDGDVFPSEYTGNLFAAGFLLGRIYRVELSGDGKGIVSVSPFFDKGGAIYDVRVGHDGALYYLASSELADGADELWRIRYDTGGEPTLSYTGYSRPGSYVNLGVTGPPGSTVELISSTSRRSPPLETPEGLLEVGEPSARVPLGEIGSGGTLVVSTAVPLNSSGMIHYLQAVVTSESGSRLTKLLVEPIYSE